MPERNAMSAYSNDPRVVINADGSARVLGDWRVWPANVGDRHGWAVVNDSGQGHLRDESGATSLFATVDAGIAAVIGPPR
jgi:hypothetical protein